MQSGNNYLLTQEEIQLGIQIIKRKVLRFFKDAKILAENNGELPHCVGLYLESSRQWNSDELHSEAGSIQISVGMPDLLPMIDRARTFVNSYC